MPESGRRLALLIGLSQYRYLQPLAGPQHDVNELAGTLRAQSDFHCIIAERTDYAGIRDQIHQFIRELQPVDTGLLFYSGHGVPGGDGSIYLSTYDMTLEDPSQNGFSEEEVRRFFRTSKAKAFVAIIDCCYAGAFTENGKGNPSQAPSKVPNYDPGLGSGRGVVIMAATDHLSTAPAANTKGSSRLSPYTELVIEGLRGAADKGEPYVTAQGVARFASEAAARRGLGFTPTWGGAGMSEGPIHLVKNPREELGKFPEQIIRAVLSKETFSRIGGYFQVAELGRGDPEYATAARTVLERGHREAFRLGGTEVYVAIASILERWTKEEMQAENIHRTQAAVSELTRRLTDADAERARIAERSDALATSLQATELERDSASSAVASLSGRLQTIVVERDHAQKALSDLSQQLQNVTDSYDAAVLSITDLKKRLKQVELQRDAAIATAADNDPEPANAALADAMRKLRDLKSERDELNASVTNLNTSMTNLNARLREADDNLLVAARSVADAEASAADAEARAQRAEVARDNALNAAADLMQRLATERDAVNDLTSEWQIRLNETRDELSAVVSKLREKDAALAVARGKISEMTTRFAALEAVHDSLKVEWEQLGAKLSSISSSAISHIKSGARIMAMVGGAMICLDFFFWSFLKPIDRPVKPPSKDEILSAAIESPIHALSESNVPTQGVIDAPAIPRAEPACTPGSTTSPPVTPQVTHTVVFDPDPQKCSEATNIAPGGRPWSNVNACMPYLSYTPNTWKSQYQLDYASGTYFVSVYTPPDVLTDEQAEQYVRHFDASFPNVKFGKLSSTNHKWPILITGGVDQSTATKLCSMAKSCIMADAKIYYKGKYLPCPD